VPLSGADSRFRSPSRRWRRSNRPPSRSSASRPNPSPQPGPAARAARESACGPARHQIHLRDLRGRIVEPVGARRRAGCGGNARPLLQPLFIYGDSGLGKTHLLHAIGNYVTENYPRRKVLYVTTETFMNDFVDSLRTSTTLTFKRRYRDCDVLLIATSSSWSGKEGLQEEFFHTYKRPQGGLQADRPDLGSASQIHRDPRGPPCAAASSPA